MCTFQPSNFINIFTQSLLFCLVAIFDKTECYAHFTILNISSWLMLPPRIIDNSIENWGCSKSTRYVPMICLSINLDITVNSQFLVFGIAFCCKKTTVICMESCCAAVLCWRGWQLYIGEQLKTFFTWEESHIFAAISNNSNWVEFTWKDPWMGTRTHMKPNLLFFNAWFYLCQKEFLIWNHTVTTHP
jgi:hypothetical protein